MFFKKGLAFLNLTLYLFKIQKNFLGNNNNRKITRILKLETSFFNT